MKEEKEEKGDQEKKERGDEEEEEDQGVAVGRKEEAFFLPRERN